MNRRFGRCRHYPQDGGPFRNNAYTQLLPAQTTGAIGVTRDQPIAHGQPVIEAYSIGKRALP
jgi:hypothetical protein